MDFLKRLFNLLLMRKSFSYTVQMSPQDCLQLIRGLSQPKTGFVNAISQTVFLTKEERHFRFEICIERYGRNGSTYNAVKAAGTITATIDKTARTIVNGNIRFGLHFLAKPISFLVPLVLIVLRSDLFWSYLVFYILWFAFVLFYVIRDYGDYQRLENLIHDTFSETGKAN
ncbi:MAG: hypothetical protein GC179_01865 [Anaerolineaceae bacterium]|nr:hypothetical protein [Anaerolineaceae bacterium]